MVYIEIHRECFKVCIFKRTLTHICVWEKESERESDRVFVCSCVCVSVCVCVYSLYIFVVLFNSIYLNNYMYIFENVYMYIFENVYIYMQTCVFAHIIMHAYCLYTCYSFICASLHIFTKNVFLKVFFWYIDHQRSWHF